VCVCVCVCVRVCVCLCVCVSPQPPHHNHSALSLARTCSACSLVRMRCRAASDASSGPATSSTRSVVPGKNSPALRHERGGEERQAREDGGGGGERGRAASSCWAALLARARANSAPHGERTSRRARLDSIGSVRPPARSRLRPPHPSTRPPRVKAKIMKFLTLAVVRLAGCCGRASRPAQSADIF